MLLHLNFILTRSDLVFANIKSLDQENIKSIVGQEFICSKKRFRSKKSPEKNVQRDETREGFKVFIYAVNPLEREGCLQKRRRSRVHFFY